MMTARLSYLPLDGLNGERQEWVGISRSSSKNEAILITPFEGVFESSQARAA